jgi:NAD(P)-dependent dehydrogenase (short-subunit alcohol dehydrogenase family)
VTRRGITYQQPDKGDVEMTGRLDGLIAVVTGGGRGLGRAVALEFAAEGAKLVVNDLGADTSGTGRDSKRAQIVVEQIEAAGGDAIADGGDIAAWDDAETMIGKALDRWGKLDILVNAAGNARLGTILDTPPEDFDAILRVHLRGYFNTAHFAAKHWVERGDYGRLINFSSSAAWVSQPSLLAYSAAKAGVVGLTRSTANALAAYKVTANCLRPHASTGMSDATKPEARKYFAETGRAASDDAAGTLRDPRHVTPLVVFLASPSAAHISGRLFEGRGGKYVLWSESEEERVIELDFLADGEAVYEGLGNVLGAGLSLRDLKAPMAPLDVLGDWRETYGTQVPAWDFIHRDASPLGGVQADGA